MAWYDTGTVSVTNGSTTVTGSGTNFIAGAQIGEAFYGPDGRIYEIQAIVSATSLTLADPYLGSTQSGQAYKIVPTQSLVATLASQVSELISDFQGVADLAGEGKFDDGSAESPGITFNLDQDTGFSRPAANQIGVSTAGVQRLLLTTTGLTSTVDVTIPDKIVHAGDTNTSIRFPAADTVTVETNGAERLRVTSTGNVGIGTITPGSALQVQGLITGTAVTQSATDTTAGRLTKVGDFGLGGTSVTISGTAAIDDISGAGLESGFYNLSSGDAGLPFGASVGTLFVNRRNTASASQLLVRHRQDNNMAIWFRNYAGGQWSPWAYNFNNLNTVGTVSQSSGVPTGAIIERGSNANGEFVKFADGTMICTLVSPTLTASTAVGNVFTSAANTRTLPATFSAVPKVAFSASRVAGTIGHWAGSGSPTTTTVDVRLLTAVTGATGTVDVIAVGSWF
jgi:hypothetical protein